MPTACDIIVPIWNQPEMTRRCLKRVLCSTKIPYRLILIDNGSDPETRQLLEDFAREQADQTTLIRNPENLGFIKATNQGLRASTAPAVCLLNNDTVVTEGWLEELLRVAENDPAIGLVNANSNTFGTRPSTDDIQGIERCAVNLRGRAGQIRELSTAVGFCLLIKRQVLEAIGVLDELFGMGNFEDADFSQRARRAKYRCVLALGSYVYHEEKVSFKRQPKWEEAFRRNRRIYEERWGRPLRVVWEKHEGDLTDRWVSVLTDLAVGGHWVTISAPLISVPLRHALERYTGLAHMETPGPWRAQLLWYLLKRRKKPVDVVITHDRQFNRWASLLRFGHRAEISYRPTPEQTQEQCLKLSRSLSS